MICFKILKLIYNGLTLVWNEFLVKIVSHLILQMNNPSRLNVQIWWPPL